MLMGYRLRGWLSLVLAALMLLALFTPSAALAGADARYYIEVDVGNQIVTIYDAVNMGVVRQMLCSSGKKLRWTPLGEYVLQADEKHTDRDPWYKIGEIYVRYATRITGKVLFHSIPYYMKSVDCIDRDALKQFGMPASHGCIRLRWQDARFIAENCGPGTRVKILCSDTRDDELRALLLQESFDASKGFSYESFLGLSDQPDVLDRHSRGQAVTDLQYRLRDLGVYGGEISGAYDSATVNAVRYAQYLLGVEATGLATPEFVRAIFAADAPTAMNVPLETGMGGPAVKRLQANLKTLRLYGDALDSVYDAGVVDGVRQFQRIYGYEVDGVASPTVQKAIAYEAGRLADAFGESDYSCEWSGEPLVLARVEAADGIRLRESASMRARQLQRLPDKRVLVVLKKGDGWTRVSSGGEAGYVRNDLVRFGSQMVGQLTYADPSGDTVLTVGNSGADYRGGAELPCNVFEDYLELNDSQVDLDNLGSYVTVDTGDGDAPLNLRAAPDGESAVLATVNNGKDLRVVRRTGDWTQVTYQGQSGYLMNRYLMFWTGPKDALVTAVGAGTARSSFTGYATVQSATDDEAAVYAEDMDDAKVLGHLPDGASLEVLEMVGGWCRISYKGHEGYMAGEDLAFDDTMMKVSDDRPEDGLS